MRESTVFELAHEGNLDALKTILQGEKNIACRIDETKRSLLHWACSGGKEDIVAYLLEEFHVSFDEPDDSGWTPLMIVSSCGHLGLVKELIKRGAKSSAVNVTGQSSLHYAASKNHVEIVGHLIENGADCNLQDKTTYAAPIHRASSKGNKAVVQALIGAKAKLSLQDIEGNTPLHMACEEEREDVIQMLLTAGAPTDTLNKAKKTPFDMAPSRLQKALIK